VKWGAHEVDGRVAAQNAVKIRAALRQSIDAKQLFDDYQLSQPHASGNMTQDRARARAWAIMNIRFNNDALATALIRLWAEAWVLGDDAAGEALFEGRQAMKAVQGTVDWSKWKAGDKVAALMLRKPKAFQKILDDMGIALKGMDKTSMDRIGTALADSIELGLSPTSAAKLINNAVGNPARALTIAITETSRVLNVAAVTRYKDAGVESMKWMTVLAVAGGSVACEICAPNNGVVIKLGESFPSGNMQPPAHPHCRCALLPDFSEYAAPTEHGVVTVPTPKPEVKPEVKKPYTPQTAWEHKPGKWSKPKEGTAALDALREQRRSQTEQMRNTFISPSEFAKKDPTYMVNSDLSFLGKTTQQRANKVVYTNGGTVVIMNKKAQTPVADILKAVDEMQAVKPIQNLILMVDNDTMISLAKARPSATEACAMRWQGRPNSYARAMIWINHEAKLGGAHPDPDKFFMPVGKDYSAIKYTLSHEWGHSIEANPAGSLSYQMADDAIKAVIKKEGRQYLSTYGKSDAAEAYAECFADWIYSKGTSENPLTQAMAKEFGW